MRGFEISKYQVISNVFVAFVSFILFFLPAVSIIFDIRFFHNIQKNINFLYWTDIIRISKRKKP